MPFSNDAVFIFAEIKGDLYKISYVSDNALNTAYVLFLEEFIQFDAAGIFGKQLSSDAVLLFHLSPVTKTDDIFIVFAQYFSTSAHAILPRDAPHRR